LELVAADTVHPLLWVPFYNFVEPALWGIPFFYWYQFLWVILTSALIIWVHYKND